MVAARFEPYQRARLSRYNSALSLGEDMQRREFITLIGSAAVMPVAAHAQQATMPVIGFLHGATPEAYSAPMAAFRKSLSEAGYSEGLNVMIEFRWAEGRLERLPELATDLVRRQVSVIFAGGGAEPALAAKAATSKIPIVFANGVDPVEVGPSILPRSRYHGLQRPLRAVWPA
jgi:putative ABC transport system substrate-binding protein